jgi:hypothetical protein
MLQALKSMYCPQGCYAVQGVHTLDLYHTFHTIDRLIAPCSRRQPIDRQPLEGFLLFLRSARSASQTVTERRTGMREKFTQF